MVRLISLVVGLAAIVSAMVMPMPQALAPLALGALLVVLATPLNWAEGEKGLQIGLVEGLVLFLGALAIWVFIVQPGRVAQLEARNQALELEIQQLRLMLGQTDYGRAQLISTQLRANMGAYWLLWSASGLGSLAIGFLGLSKGPRPVRVFGGLISVGLALLSLVGVSAALENALLLGELAELLTGTGTPLGFFVPVGVFGELVAAVMALFGAIAGLSAIFKS